MIIDNLNKSGLRTVMNKCKKSTDEDIFVVWSDKYKRMILGADGGGGKACENWLCWDVKSKSAK